ncbi:hypothetical protein PG989_015848 [Apiospora arundinis]
MSREPITPAADVAPAPPAAEKPAKPPRLLGLNHLKLASHDILATRDFYTTVFPFTPLPAYDHRRADGSLFAVMFRHDLKPAGTGTGSGTGTGNTLIEARHNSQQAAAQVGWDPVTWGGRHPRRPGRLGALAGPQGRGALAGAPRGQGVGALCPGSGWQDRSAVYRGGTRVGVTRGR